ncbi:hypothetical protein HWV62_35119 [Athelia sp. TMB]|nr:hypothetical protein HWV62_35119 [Athelia sp. TMB]
MDQEHLPEKTPEAYPLVAGFSPQTLGIASFLFAVLCLSVKSPLVFYLSKRKSGSKGTALLLVGPPDSGKTAILSTLVYKQTLPTHTSLQSNSSVVELTPSKTLRIVDVPGHPRVRDQFQEYLSDAKAVAFVVDTSTVSRNGPAVAEHLHHILNALTSLPPSQTLPRLLIVAHKSDLLKTTSSTTASTLAVNRVTTILERELEKRRASQSGGVGVEGLGAEGERADMGGLECSGASGGAFKFAEWEGGEVEFLAAFVKVAKGTEVVDEKSDSADGLEAFQEWLNEI